MSVNNKDFQKISTIALVVALIVVSFIVLQPILISIIIGLILAYACMPIYRFTQKNVRNKNASAFIVSFLLLLVIVIPMWFLIPMLVQQTIDLFSASQTFDIRQVMDTVFPSASNEFKTEAISLITTYIGQFTTSTLNSLIGILLDLPQILLQLTVVFFVFFFTLRDYEFLRAFVSDISPFRKDKEKVLAKQFRDVTSSVVYGYVLVGIIQGIASGVGFYLFGVPQVLALTVIATFASILPMIGPWLVWIPVALFLFAQGDIGMAIGFSIYSLVFVSAIDNLLRPYIISKRTGTSPAIILVGMVGGLLVFGLMGLLLGPLILSYLIVLLSAYRSKTLSDLFRTD